MTRRPLQIAFREHPEVLPFGDLSLRSQLRIGALRALVCGGSWAGLFLVGIHYANGDRMGSIPWSLLGLGVLGAAATGAFAGPLALIELRAHRRTRSLRRDLIAAGLTFGGALVMLGAGVLQYVYLTTLLETAQASKALAAVSAAISEHGPTADPLPITLIGLIASPFAVAAFARLRGGAPGDQLKLTITLPTLAGFFMLVAFSMKPLHLGIALLVSLEGLTIPLLYRAADLLEATRRRARAHPADELRPTGAVTAAGPAQPTLLERS